jgi:hypothetical protein
VVPAREEDEPLVRRPGSLQQRPRVGGREEAVLARAEDQKRRAQPGDGIQCVELGGGAAAVRELLLARDADHARDLRAEPRACDHARDAAEGGTHQEDLPGALVHELRHGAREVFREAPTLVRGDRRLREPEVAVVEREHPEACRAQNLGVGQPAAEVGRGLVCEDDPGRTVAQRRAVEQDAVRRPEPADLCLYPSRVRGATAAERRQAASLRVQRSRRPPAATDERDGEEEQRGGGASQRRRRMLFRSFSRSSSARRIRSSTSSCSAWR